MQSPIKHIAIIMDGNRLAGAGDAEERLELVTCAQRRHELRDRLRLIARGLVVGAEFEKHG